MRTVVQNGLEIVAEWRFQYLADMNKLINFYFPLKSSEYLWFSDDFGGGGIEVN